MYSELISYTLYTMYVYKLIVLSQTQNCKDTLLFNLYKYYTITFVCTNVMYIFDNMHGMRNMLLLKLLPRCYTRKLNYIVLKQRKYILHVHVEIFQIGKSCPSCPGYIVQNSQ